MTSELADESLDHDLRRNGAVIMSVFAFVWSVGVPGFADATVQWSAFGAALVVTVVLVTLAIRGRPVQRQRRMPSDWQRRYNRVGLIQGVAIGLMLIAGLTLVPAIVTVLGRFAFWPL